MKYTQLNKLVRKLILSEQRRLDENLLTKILTYVQKVSDKGKYDYVKKKVEEETPEYTSALHNLEKVKTAMANQIKDMSKEQKIELDNFLKDLGF